MGYNEKAIKHYEECGKDTHIYILGSCRCRSWDANLRKNCDLSFCSDCSKRRKRRWRNRLLPYLIEYPNNSMYQWRFLTLSPLSFKTYEEGQKVIRKSWNKFIRRNYIDERIKGCFYVIEVNEDGNGWHFHIHAIVYSRYLDSAYRGHCEHCGQNYMRYNKVTKKFYCANRKCNQLYEGPIQNRLKEEFEKSSGLVCQQIEITRASSPNKVLNYMLKYITEVQTSFSSIDTYCYHISKTYKFRQITGIREFHNYKSKNKKVICKPRCSRCRCIIHYQIDWEVSHILNEASFNPKIEPPPDLNHWIKEEKPAIKREEKKNYPSSEEEKVFYDNKKPDVETIKID